LKIGASRSAASSILLDPLKLIRLRRTLNIQYSIENIQGLTGWFGNAQ
jgi:hypothetical protein